MVELALVVPLLAALLLGMSELGQALRVKAILAEASRKACAAGSRPGGGNADVLSEVQNVLSGAGLPANAATVTVLVNNQAGNVATAMRNDKVTVTVAIPWSAVQLTGTNAFQAGNSVQSVSTSMLKPG